MESCSDFFITDIRDSRDPNRVSFRIGCSYCKLFYTQVLQSRVCLTGTVTVISLFLQLLPSVKLTIPGCQASLIHFLGEEGEDVGGPGPHPWPEQPCQPSVFICCDNRPEEKTAYIGGILRVRYFVDSHVYT